MSKPNRPTLIFPNGGESILTRAIEISWLEPRPLSTDNLPVWYEVFYSEDYDGLDEPDWKQIASVPAGTTKFQWKIGNYIKSQYIRVAVCAVNTRGERSLMSVSADSFEIKREFPLTPSVLSPVPQTRYGNSVDIVFDDIAITNTFGQRAKYYVFFSSEKARIPFSPIAQKVPVGTGPLIWDTSLLPPSDDYIITVYLADDSGNKSDEVNIRDIEIVNEGMFLIDTQPPSGYVDINNGAEFTRRADVTVRLFAYDRVTGPHSMEFVEGDHVSSPESYVNLKYYRFVNEQDGTLSDGQKTLKVLFQDFGANRTSELHKIFRTTFQLNNDDIADVVLELNTGTLWVGINGTQPALYKIDATSNFQTNVPESINALGILNSTAYISVTTDDHTALVYRWNGEMLVTIIGLSDTDSEVLSLETYRQSLYAGSLSGALYRYNEIAVDLIHTFDAPVAHMFSDGSLLYILLRNKPSIFIYDGSSFTEVLL